MKVLKGSSLLLAVVLAGCGSFQSNTPPTLDLVAAGFEPATEAQLAPFELVPMPSPPPRQGPIFIVPKGANILLKATAKDRDDVVELSWQDNVKVGDKAPAFATFEAKDEGRFFVTVQASDGREGGVATETVGLQVIAPHGAAPKIASFLPDKFTAAPGGQYPVEASATDTDGDSLTYRFLASGGSLSPEKSSDGRSVYTAPETPGDYTLFCVVSDGHGQISSKSIAVTVKK